MARREILVKNPLKLMKSETSNLNPQETAIFVLFTNHVFLSSLLN